MRVMSEYHVTWCKAAHLWTDLDHSADARVAVLDREAGRTTQCRQVELDAIWHLTTKHEHFGAVADRGSNGTDAYVSRTKRLLLFSADLDLARTREPDAGCHLPFEREQVAHAVGLRAQVLRIDRIGWDSQRYALHDLDTGI